MKKPGLVLFFVLLQLSFAAKADRLTPDDVQGIWETAGFVPYARLIFDDRGEGVLVAVYSKENQTIFVLEEFSSTKGGFTVNLRNTSDSTQQEKMTGSLFGGQLHLQGEAGDDEGIWFARAGQIAEFSQIAEEEYQVWLSGQKRKQ